MVSDIMPASFQLHNLTDTSVNGRRNVATLSIAYFLNIIKFIRKKLNR